MSNEVELRVSAHAQVGEGPIWDEEKQVLYWIDIMSSKLFVYDPVTEENKAFNVGQHVGTVVPFTSDRRHNEVMLAVHNGFASFNLTTEELTIINDPEPHLPKNRFNDGKCDPAGRFWAGSMAYEDYSTQGSLYRLDEDLSVHKMLGDLGISNGIIWSHDNKTMYFVDSMRYNIRAFDYDVDSGDIQNERVIIDIPPEMSIADGMTIDVEGMLWVAHFGGSCVRRWNPDTAELLETITLPARDITACAFGGKDLDTLFITCAAIQYSEEELKHDPYAGGLFSIKPGHQGVPANRFAG